MEKVLERSGDLKLFYSSGRLLWECPRKFYYSHEKGLKPATPPPASLRYGKAVDDGICVSLELSKISVQKLEEYHQHMKLQLEQEELPFDMWQVHVSEVLLWLEEHAKLEEVQYGVPVQVELPPFLWLGEADMLIPLKDGQLWLGEVKTTSGYGPSTQRYFMDDPQVWSYLWALLKKEPSLKGFILFVLTKTKDPKLHVEWVPLRKTKLLQVERYIYDTLKLYMFYKDANYWPQNRGACVKLWGECEYYILCEYPETSKEYEELCSQSFIQEDPFAHLERRKELKERWNAVR